MGSGVIGSGQDEYPRKVYRTRINRAAGAALRGYERVDRAALRLASRAIPTKTRQHIQAQRELFGGDIHLAVPVGRERAVAIRIPDRLKHFRHAILPAALLVTLLVALQANAAVTGYGGTHTVSASGNQSAREAYAYNESLYVSGTLQGSADFGASYGATDVKAAAGPGATVYISKTVAGAYGWTRVLTDSTDQLNVASIHAGANGASGGEAVYVTGEFNGEVNFAADFGGSDIKTAVGLQDGYITRINADGSYGWTYTFGNTDSSARPTGVAYDPAAAVVIVAGTFDESMQFDPGGPVRTAPGDNGFILWLDDNATSAAYIRDYHLVSGAGINPTSITTTNSEVLVAGEFETDATFEMSGSPVAAPATGDDGFLLRLGLDGAYQSVQTFGGTGQESVKAIRTMSDGTTYVAGTMTANVTFRDLGATSASTNATDSFVLQVSPGDVNTWVRVLGSDNAQAVVEGIAVGSDGLVYAAGTYSGSVDFEESFGGSDIQQSHGSSSAFLTTFSNAAYDATYTMGAEAADDPASTVGAHTIAASNPDELLYVAGDYTDSIDFGLPFSDSDVILSSGGSDAYVTAVVTREPRTLSGGGLQYYSEDTNLSSSGTQELAPAVTIRDDDDTYLAELTVDMAENRTWTTTGDTDHVGHKSVIANLTNQTGASATFTFYVPKGAGDKAVAICPGVETLVAVISDCATRQTFVVDAGVTIQNIAGIDYWVLPGRTETSIGGMSLAYPGLAITPPAGGLSVTEGSNATFSVALHAAPSDDVTLTPNVDLPAQLSGGGALTFTTENWQTPQDIVFTAVDDSLADGPIDATLSWTLASTDNNYNAANEPTIVLQVLDNDSAGIAWAPTSILTSEASAADELCVTLTAEPTDAVTLALNSSDTSEATVSSPLVIEPADWDAATNCATVSPVNDDETDGTKDTVISATGITSDDQAFASLSTSSFATVTASVQDDDIAGLVFSVSDANQTTESGGSVQLCVELTAMPLADVTVPLSSSDISEGALSGTEFVISPEDWNAATNCITVTGQNDDLLDGDIAYSVLTGDPASADPTWDALGETDTTNLTLTNNDDDNAGITVSEPSVGIAEGGATDTFQVNLESQPAPGQEVHVAVISSDSAQLAATPSTLTFTGSDWSTPQVVTITATDDSLLENAHDKYLTVTVLETTTEEPYLPLGDQVISATITDNDSAEATVQATSNATENGDNGEFTLALSKQNDTASAITVSYEVLAESTAGAGVEYTALSGSVLVPVGQSSTSISVSVAGHNNELLQGNRSVQIELTGTNTGSVTIGTTSTASVLILDDESATASLAVSPSEEGGDPMVFTATLSRTNNTGSAMVLELDETGGTATSGADYTPFGASTITILDGASTGTLSVAATDDELLEPSTESVTAELSSFPLPPSVTLDSDDYDVQATLADNDQADVVVTASNATEPATAGSFELQLSKINQTGAPIVVTFTVVGTATSGTDFTALGTTVNIADGEDSASIVLTPIDDTDIEAAETVEVALTETDFGRALIGVPENATATITDNESASVTVTTPDDTTGEDGATAQICFALGSRPSASVTIALSSTDTSKVTVPASVTVERDSWNDPTCIIATGQDDTPPSVTGTQDVSVNTGNVTSSDAFYEALTGAAVNDPTLHHADNDQPAVIVTSVDAVTSEDGETSAHVRFSLSSEPTAAVTIPVNVDDASEGSLAGETEVVISPASWNLPANNELIIHGVDDNLTDGIITYHLVTSAATSADSNYANAVVGDVTLTNTDDDTAGVNIDASSANVTEGSSLTQTVALTSQPAPGKQVVITATPSNNQVDLGGGAGVAIDLTFTNTSWSAQEITMSAVDDALLESTHTSVITYAIDDATDEQAYLDYDTPLPNPTLTVTDNDTANAVLSAASNTENEEELLLTVTLDKANNTGAPISFELNTTGGSATATADYTALVGATISVANGNTTGTATVSVANDNDLEGNETVEATISSSSLAAVNITGAAVTATILDDENADATVTATDPEATEGSANGGEFTISLSQPNKTGESITVSYDVSGTASIGTDYVALSGSVSIPNNDSSATISVATTANDEVVEGDETILVTLTEASSTQVNIDATPASVTLHDDDAYIWSITKLQDGLEDDGEGTPQNIQFVISTNKVNTTGSDMTITLSDPLTGSASNAQDYVSFGGNVSVPDGQSSTTVSITVANDNLLEQTLESVDTVITAPSAGVLHPTDVVAQANITDNDDTTAALSAASTNESDENGLIFTVTLDHENATGAPIDFDFATTAAGSATAGSDFTAAGGATISIAPGDATGAIAVEMLNDAAMEGDETVQALTGGSNFGRVDITGAETLATIQDDDQATATVIATDADATENSGNSGLITAALSIPNNTPDAITISYTVSGTAAAGSDYAALSATVQIPVGESSATIPVTTTLNDEVVEGPETVIVTLQSADQALVAIDTNPATVTIADDDAYSWSITKQSDGLEQGPQAASFAIHLSKTNTTGSDMTVVLTDPMSGAATKSQDYIPFDATVAIPNGSDEALVNITVNNDALLESLEDIDAVISSPSEGTIAVATASANITDNDTASATLSATDGNETGSDITFTTTLDKTNSTNAPVTFTLDTTGGTATANSDYAALNGAAVSIPIGSNSASVTAEVGDDTDMEGSETVTASLSASSNASVTITGNTTTATIIDNDTAAASAIATTPTAYEDGSAGGQVTLQLSRVNKTPGPISLTYSVGGTATSGDDFTPLSGNVQIPVDASSVTVNVDALDDEIAEGSETVVVTLTSSSHSLVSVGGQNVATVTIVDDDSFGWSIAALQNGTENGDSATLRVQLSQQNATGHDLTATLSDPMTGSAVEGSDYTAFGTTVTVPNGASYVDVTIPVLDDAALELIETIGATLSDPSEGDIAVDTATATITDDETATLTIAATQPTATENPTQNGQFTISLDHANESDAPILVAYTISGSAVGGADYAQLSGSAAIPAGQDATTIWVDMASYDDSLFEPDETVILTLVNSNHSGISIGSPGDAAVTVQSDDAAPVNPPGPTPTLVMPSARVPSTTYVPLPATPAQSKQPAPAPPSATPSIDQEAKDEDSDGIEDSTEAKAHNFGDGNGDGIPDNTQANVSSLVSAITQRPVTLAAMGECTDITSFTVVSEGELNKDDFTHRYPHGLVDYAVACGKPGQSTEVAVYYDEQLDGEFTWRKLAQPTLEFRGIDSAETLVRAVGQGNVTVVSYAVSDGGSLDDDGKADGKILDPAGLASSIFQPRDLLWLTPVVLFAGVLIARAGTHHHREHHANRAKIAKF